MHNMCRTPGIVNADYVIVQDENIKAQFEQHDPDGKPLEGKFLAIGSPKFDKVLTWRLLSVPCFIGKK